MLRLNITFRWTVSWAELTIIANCSIYAYIRFLASILILLAWTLYLICIAFNWTPQGA